MGFWIDEPFGGPIEDYRAGLSPMVAFNMNRDKDTDPIDAFAFFRWHQAPEPTPQTAEEISDRLRLMLNSKAVAAAKDTDGN